MEKTLNFSEKEYSKHFNGLLTIYNISEIVGPILLVILATCLVLTKFQIYILSNLTTLYFLCIALLLNIVFIVIYFQRGCLKESYVYYDEDGLTYYEYVNKGVNNLFVRTLATERKIRFSDIKNVKVTKHSIKLYGEVTNNKIIHLKRPKKSKDTEVLNLPKSFDGIDQLGEFLIIKKAN